MAGLAATAIVLADSNPVFAQNCVMCYNTAAAAKASAIQALRSGILILLIPPALMFIGIFAFAFRSKDRFSDENVRETDYDEELRNWILPPGSAGVSPTKGQMATRVRPAQW